MKAFANTSEGGIARQLARVTAERDRARELVRVLVTIAADGRCRCGADAGCPLGRRESPLPECRSIDAFVAAARIRREMEG